MNEIKMRESKELFIIKDSKFLFFEIFEILEFSKVINLFGKHWINRLNILSLKIWKAL